MAKKIKRSAPQGGYDFGPKRNYRRAVWGGIREGLRDVGKGLGDANVMLMPSLEGDEIDEARKRGASVKNMHAVDRNPAIVAHIKRRYPQVSTYGVDIDRALYRAASTGVRLDAVNLDLCGPCTDEALQTAGYAAYVIRCGVVAMTMLRGRETKTTARTWHEARDTKRWKELVYDTPFVGPVKPKDGDAARIVALLWACHTGQTEHGQRPVTVALKRWGIYKSTAGNQTMLWAVVVLGGGEMAAQEEAETMAIKAAYASVGEIDKALAVREKRKAKENVDGWLTRVLVLGGTVMEQYLDAHHLFASRYIDAIERETSRTGAA